MNTNILSISMAIVGTVGIAMYFNIDEHKIPSIAFGGLMSWIIYLVCFYFTKNFFISSFTSSIIISFYSEIMARVLKTPANIILIPSIVPLLPGGSFYYAMNAILSMDIDLFKQKGFETLILVLGITTGIVIGYFLYMRFTKIKSLIKFNSDNM